MPHNPQRLLVVQKADVLVVELHVLAKRHKRQLSELSPGLRNQLLRAAVSISANLGEACGHVPPMKAADRIDSAIGSLNEVERMLRFMRRLNAFDSRADALVQEVGTVRALAYGFRRKILREAGRPTVNPAHRNPTSDL